MTLNNSIISFDIGGTWLRACLLDEKGEIRFHSKKPSINYLNNPSLTATILQSRLVEYIISEVGIISKSNGTQVDTVVISMGAAINGQNGMVLNSGPLWGPNCEPFDLSSSLKAFMPMISWHVYNDISASLMCHVFKHGYVNKKACLITISTGIGMRIYDPHSKSIPCGRETGLQGEIGHLPTNFNFFGKLLDLKCDCGGSNHLNAFSSGRGVENILKKISRNMIDCSGSSLKWPVTLPELKNGLDNEDQLSNQIIAMIVKPITDSILWILTIDPLIDVIFITGGLYEYLNKYYSSELMQQLEFVGLYQTSEYHPSFFKDKLLFSDSVQNAGLLGASYCWLTKEQIKVY